MLRCGLRLDANQMADRGQAVSWMRDDLAISMWDCGSSMPKRMTVHEIGGIGRRASAYLAALLLVGYLIWFISTRGPPNWGEPCLPQF